MKFNSTIPPFAEKRKIEQPTAQKVIQEILNQDRLKQPIPTNFIKLKVEEENYTDSTNPK